MALPTCAISGCTHYPPYFGRHLCQEHWKEYGHLRGEDMPAWLRRLINFHQQDLAYETHRAPLVSSLDGMLEAGRIDSEDMNAFRAVGIRAYRRKPLPRPEGKPIGKIIKTS